MRNLSCVALAVLLSCLAAAQPATAQKTTVDPNAPGAAKTSSSKPGQLVDERLAQEVTYEAGQERLHTILKDLSDLAGVTIRCGTSTKDWPVRDIPLTICVKKMPLGKLMQAIADTSHTVIKSESQEADEPLRYRFARDLKTKEEIAAAGREVNETRWARIGWSWDALVKFGESSISEPKVNMDLFEQMVPPERRDAESEQLREGLDRAKFIKPLGQILASLGPEWKARVLAGETIVLRAQDSAQSAVLRDYYWAVWEKLNSYSSPALPEELPTQEDIDKARLLIGIRNTSGPGWMDLYASLFPVKLGRGVTTWGASLDASSTRLIEGLDIPTPPSSERFYQPQIDYQDSKFDFLRSQEDWNQPVLQAKLKLELPEERNELTYGDVLIALSEASGFNIICEDFKSHQQDSYTSIGGLPRAETTLGEVLRLLAGDRWGTTSGCWWSVNSEDNLIIGWAQGWRWKHQGLIPEKLFASTRKKLNGEGLTLDAAASLMNLTARQFRDWISCSRDMEVLDGIFDCKGKVLWQLYDYLTPEDRALAASAAGLPLSKVDPIFLRQFLRERMRETDIKPPVAVVDEKGLVSEAQEERTKIQYWRMQEALSDPELLHKLAIRVKSQAVTYRASVYKPGGIPIPCIKQLPPGRERREYSIALEGDYDGEKLSISVPLSGLCFPVYSFQREEELEKMSKSPGASH